MLFWTQKFGFSVLFGVSDTTHMLHDASRTHFVGVGSSLPTCSLLGIHNQINVQPQDFETESKYDALGARSMSIPFCCVSSLTKPRPKSNMVRVLSHTPNCRLTQWTSCVKDHIMDFPHSIAFLKIKKFKRK